MQHLSRLILFFFIHITGPTLGLQCPRCEYTTSFWLEESISTALSKCNDFVPSSSCLQSLHIRYDQNEATVSFEPTPNDILILPTISTTMVNKTVIWFKNGNSPIKVNRYFDIYCSTNDTCTKERLINIFDKGTFHE